MLIDPGTYTYVASQKWRNWFRSSSAHNTVCVDGRNQATPAGPFSWSGGVRSRLEAFALGIDKDIVAAECTYEGVRHRRAVTFLKAERLIFLFDEIVAEPEAPHSIVQFWHVGGAAVLREPRCVSITDRAYLVLDQRTEVSLEVGGSHGWRSPVHAVMAPSPVVTASVEARSPAYFAAVLDLRGKVQEEATHSVTCREAGGRVTVRYTRGTNSSDIFEAAFGIGIPHS